MMTAATASRPTLGHCPVDGVRGFGSQVAMGWCLRSWISSKLGALMAPIDADGPIVRGTLRPIVDEWVEMCACGIIRIERRRAIRRALEQDGENGRENQ